jgi:hypothetical protein
LIRVEPGRRPWRFPLSRPLVVTLTAACAGWLAVSCGAPQAVQSARVLPFIADDFPRALTEARARQVPVFAEVWAPW